MPLFELFQMTKEKFDSDKQKTPSSSTDFSFQPENDLVELVWENGQILMQGQTSRTKKSPACNSLPSHWVPSHTPKNRDKDVGNGSSAKMAKYGTADSVFNEIRLAEPSGEMGLNQDDDTAPWLNYRVDESSQQDYCSDFLHALSGVTTGNNFASFDKRSSSDQSSREFNNVSASYDASLEYGNLSMFSSIRGGEATTLRRSSTSSLYTSSSQQCQTSFPHILRPRLSESSAQGSKNLIDHGIFRGSNPTSAGSLSGSKMQKLYQRLSTDNSGFVNFSHFARPVAVVREGLQNIGRIGSKYKSSVASSSPLISPLIDSSGFLRKEASSNSHFVAVTSKVGVKPQAKTSELSASELPEAKCQEDDLNQGKKASQVHAETATKEVLESERTIEPVVAASSVCSGNSVERVSDDRPHNLKRKHCDPEDSECPSKEVEEESVGLIKTVPGHVGTGSKRSRAAEVHNLSERRRRDRINEKMRALQELVPNCNKVDKASMLDEVIEYLKTLQLQVQIMSMGAGFYMPPMMYPPSLQQRHAAHMAHISPMGIGMGMGMGLGYRMGMTDVNGGSSCYPMIQVPAMNGAHFPGTSVSGPSTLHGMAGSNFQPFGLPGQGHPISMPRAPVAAGRPIVKSAEGLNASGMVGPMDNTDAADGSNSKEALQNVNSQLMQTTGDNALANETSNQCEATKDPLVQAKEVTVPETFSSSSKTEKESTLMTS